MAEVLAHTGNPSSVHRGGREAKQLLEQARAQVADAVGAAPADVTFTSGGTEANHLALRGFPERRLIVSAIEHDSVLAAAPDAARLPVTGDGVADLDALERLLAADSAPGIGLADARQQRNRRDPAGRRRRQDRASAWRLLHCDAIQAFGKISFAYQ